MVPADAPPSRAACAATTSAKCYVFQTAGLMMPSATAEKTSAARSRYSAASVAWEASGGLVRNKDAERTGGKTLDQIVDLMAHDTPVSWGWKPEKGRKPVLGTQAGFDEHIKA